jgi:hypothetical protein
VIGVVAYALSLDSQGRLRIERQRHGLAEEGRKVRPEQLPMGVKRHAVREHDFREGVYDLEERLRCERRSEQVRANIRLSGCFKEVVE